MKLGHLPKYEATDLIWYSVSENTVVFSDLMRYLMIQAVQ